MNWRPAAGRLPATPRESKLWRPHGVIDSVWHRALWRHPSASLFNLRDARNPGRIIPLSLSRLGTAEIGVRRGAANLGCSRLPGGFFARERPLAFATTRSVSVVKREAALKGGCSQDWLPHVRCQQPKYRKDSAAVGPCVYRAGVLRVPHKGKNLLDKSRRFRNPYSTRFNKPSSTFPILPTAANTW